MIWYTCTLTKPSTTTDALGNNVPSGSDVVVATTQARKSPFSPEEIAVDGQIITKNQQRYILTLPFADIADAVYATIGDLKQKIVAKNDLSPRWSTITVEGYKV